MLPRRQLAANGAPLRRTAFSGAFGTSSSRQQRPSRQHHCQVSAAAAATLTGCRLAGVGSSAPATVLSNADLAQWVDTNDEWITSRTGIKRRHVLAEGETLTSHAVAACKRALEMAGVDASEVGIVLVATSTPDDAFGSACQVW
jgi:3-oxoacyl-[acyl-carrier-protein] synthase-3